MPLLPCGWSLIPQLTFLPKHSSPIHHGPTMRTPRLEPCSISSYLSPAAPTSDSGDNSPLFLILQNPPSSFPQAPQHSLLHCSPCWPHPTSGSTVVFMGLLLSSHKTPITDAGQGYHLAPGSGVLCSCLAVIPALSSMRQSPQVPKDPHTWDPARVDPGAFSTTQAKSPFLLFAFTRKKCKLAQRQIHPKDQLTNAR